MFARSGHRRENVKCHRVTVNPREARKAHNYKNKNTPAATTDSGPLSWAFHATTTPAVAVFEALSPAHTLSWMQDNMKKDGEVHVGWIYPFVLRFYSLLTSPDQRRLPLLVDPLPDGQVSDRVPAAVPRQVRLRHRGSDCAMFHRREAPEGCPQPAYQPAAASSRTEGRHHRPACSSGDSGCGMKDKRFEPIAKGGRALAANERELIRSECGWAGPAGDPVSCSWRRPVI